MRFSKRQRYVQRRTRKQRGSGNISANTPFSEVKQQIVKQYSDLLSKKEACMKKCVEYMCSKHDTTVCDQTKEFVSTKMALDSSGFCNNMMAGFPKTCRSSSSNSMAPYEDCVCDRFKHALYQFDMTKGRVDSIAKEKKEEQWFTIARITAELFEHVNKPGVILSEESRRFVRLKRQTGSISLSIL